MKNREKIAEFQKEIWDFYKKNKRSFPWRETHDPYCILVSEIMLQQTQTDRVLPKYKEFLLAFPNFESLAAASVSDVLKKWQGLGYNRRALFLKKTSEIIVRDYNNRMPRDLQELKRLPGIGAYTAGALIAFAFEKEALFIETNIRRVYIHFFFHDKDQVSDKEIIPILEETMGKKNVREWYYALMDNGVYLGKTLPNPNKKSKHYAVQSRFEGSDRKIRGEILRVLLQSQNITFQILYNHFEENKDRIDTIIKGLEKDGFITIKKNIIHLV